MILLKILFWVVVAVLVILVLLILGILFALLVKIQIQFEYQEDVKKLKLKYGIIPIKILPKKEITPEEAERRKLKRENLMSKVKSIFDKMMGVAKDKAEVIQEKNDIKQSLKNATEFDSEQDRIDSELARVEAELKMAEAEELAAEQAEKGGTPFPDVVDGEEVSKLISIKNSIIDADIPGAYKKIKSFMSGFSSESVMALLTYVGSQACGALGKVGRRIKIKQLRVALTVGGGEDAAQTAIKLGRISAVAFPAMGKLVSSANVKDFDLDIRPDFLAPKNSAEFQTVIAFRPLILLSPFITMFMKVGGKSFSFYNSYKKTKKAKASGNPTPNNKAKKASKAKTAKAAN